MERCLEWRFLRRKFDIKQTRCAIKVKFYAKHIVRRAFSSKTSLSSHAAISIPNCNCQQCSHHAVFTQLRQGFPFNWSNSALDKPLSFPFILIDASFKIHPCKAIISSWGRLIIYRSTLSGSPTNRFWCIRNDFTQLHFSSQLIIAAVYIFLSVALKTSSKVRNLQFWNWASMTHLLCSSLQLLEWSGCAAVAV